MLLSKRDAKMANKFPKPDVEAANVESPSVDKTGRFSYDGLLRQNGFKIVHRPIDGEAIWECDGEQYTFSEALASLGVALDR